MSYKLPRVSRGKVRCSKCRRRKETRLFHRMGNSFQAYCISCDLKRQRTHPRKTQLRRAKRLRVYGLTQEQFDSLLKDQDGKCAICRSKQNGDYRNAVMCVDHDHLTEKVRGLLCGKCNKAIGLLHDDPEVARRVAAYLLGGKPHD